MSVDLTNLPLGMGEGIIMIVSVVCWLLPFALVLLVLKWLYQSKKSLASIDATRGELRDIAKSQNGVREKTHE